MRSLVGSTSGGTAYVLASIEGIERNIAFAGKVVGFLILLATLFIAVMDGRKRWLERNQSNKPKG